MLFNSLQFLFFFPTVCVLFFLTPQRYRWVLLLAASYYFYMCWKVEYIVLILITTLITYTTGIQIDKQTSKRKKQLYLFACIIVNLTILFVFKYFNFFNQTLRDIFHVFDITYRMSALNVLLPVGISFYTFQSLSYTIDVYKGNKKPEKHFGIFAVYVAFFPQLVAGPIERSKNLIPQFSQKFEFDYDRITDGLRLMAWGLFKKIVIADRLSMLVDQIYNSPHDYTGIPLIIGSYFFAFQIYCDFSGYSDMAIGAARIMGFRLSQNFNYPYFAKNITDFWRRWHITLTSWFRDYIYIPLGGNRVEPRRWCYNILIVFFLSGLWHGANWTFIIWGGIHGTLILFSRFSEKLKKALLNFLSISSSSNILTVLEIIVTFNIVTFAWIFFRANNISDALYIVSHILDFGSTGDVYWQISHNTTAFMGMGLYELMISVCLIFFLVSVEFFNFRFDSFTMLLRKPIIIRWAYYYFVIFLVLIYGKFSINSFIYFQF